MSATIEPQHTVHDVAKTRPVEAKDIEHVPVHDDPRRWSKARKVPFIINFHTLKYIDT